MVFGARHDVDVAVVERLGHVAYPYPARPLGAADPLKLPGGRGEAREDRPTCPRLSHELWTLVEHGVRLDSLDPCRLELRHVKVQELDRKRISKIGRSLV